MSAPSTADSRSDPDNAALPVLVLNRDLFFGVTISNALRSLGYLPSTAGSVASLRTELQSKPQAALLIVDIAAVDDWEGLRQALAKHEAVPAIAFGSHTNVEGLRAAKGIGMDRVFSNGDFHRNLGSYILRFARPTP